MKHELSGTELVIVPDDPLAVATIKPLHDQMIHYFADPEKFQKLVIDLAGVKVIDSLGVNLLVGLYKECRKYGKAYQVSHCSQSIRRLFDLYKLTGYFGVE